MTTDLLHPDPAASVPDPSVLTSQQMFRESSALRELVFREILGLEKTLATRMDAIEKASALVHEDVTRWPTALDKGLGHLKELHQEKFNSLREIVHAAEQLQVEKFNSIKTQFAERDTRSEHDAKETKVAVDAALQAAEKAVGKQQEAFAEATSKSEASTTKQIDQQAELLLKTTGSLEQRINDLKERLGRIEGMGLGGSAVTVERRASREEQRGSNQLIIAVIAILVSAASVLAGVAIAFLKH
jgi:hypothetical protein